MVLLYGYFIYLRFMFVFGILPCLFFATLLSAAWLSGILCFLVFCHFPLWCPGTGVVLDCIDSGPLLSSLLCSQLQVTGSHRAVGNVSGCRYVSECRPRGHELDPSLVPFICQDLSWNNFYGHSPPLHWFKKGCCQLHARLCAQSTG